MNIYETFNNLRYHYENEAVEFKKAEYSMHKGLEYKKCKALLQDALEDHKFLTKMREEEIIVNETKGNISVWSLLKTKK